MEATFNNEEQMDLITNSASCGYCGNMADSKCDECGDMFCHLHIHYQQDPDDETAIRKLCPYCAR